MRIYFWLGLLLFFYANIGVAQKDTLVLKTEKRPSLLSNAIIPSVFILSGVLLNHTQTEKNWQKSVRNKVGNTYHNSADDYYQYVPYAQVYLGDMVGLKAKNHWFDQTKNIVIGGFLTTIITYSLKVAVGKDRPDNSNNNSFPSGHTTTAFMGATILYHEYKDASPAYAYSGYIFSSATGGLRVMNNKHWVSDVLAGAGLGILIANFVYYVEPLKNWNPFKKSKNLTFSPMINGNDVTFVAALTF